MILALVGVGVMAGCSSVTVETGPRSRESAREIAGNQAGDLRSIWADRFDNASPLQAAAYLKTFIDTTAGRYLDFGGQVLNRWRDLNAQSTQDLAGPAVQDMIDRSVADQRAIFEAYDDVVELGARTVRDSAYFDARDEALIMDMRDEYMGIRQFVFAPAGTFNEYRAGLEDRRRDLEDLSREVGEMFEDYR
ncbi:hypothetical protein GF377_09995 [candidate division GN15 bacterium]|nr:hypothetical protein [candidate division GN15 bacterium]